MTFYHNCAYPILYLGGGTLIKLFYIKYASLSKTIPDRQGVSGAFYQTFIGIPVGPQREYPE